MTGYEQDHGERQPLLSSGSVTPKKRSSISVDVEAVESDGLLTDGHAGYGATTDDRSPILNEVSSNEVTEAVKSANVTMSKIVSCQVYCCKSMLTYIALKGSASNHWDFSRRNGWHHCGFDIRFYWK